MFAGHNLRETKIYIKDNLTPFNVLVQGRTIIGQAQGVEFPNGKKERSITLNASYVENANVCHIYQTILHEIAHALVIQKWGTTAYNLPIIGGHGLLWIITAFCIGYRWPSRFTL